MSYMVVHVHNNVYDLRLHYREYKLRGGGGGGGGGVYSFIFFREFRTQP